LLVGIIFFLKCVNQKVVSLGLFVSRLSVSGDYLFLRLLVGYLLIQSTFLERLFYLVYLWDAAGYINRQPAFAKHCVDYLAVLLIYV